QVLRIAQRVVLREVRMAEVAERLAAVGRQVGAGDAGLMNQRNREIDSQRNLKTRTRARDAQTDAHRREHPRESTVAAPYLAAIEERRAAQREQVEQVLEEHQPVFEMDHETAAAAGVIGRIASRAAHIAANHELVVAKKTAGGVEASVEHERVIASEDRREALIDDALGSGEAVANAAAAVTP